MLFCCDGIQIKNVIDVLACTHTHTHIQTLHLRIAPCSLVYPQNPNCCYFIFSCYGLCVHAVGTSSNFIILFRSLFCFCCLFYYWIWWCRRQSNTMTGQRCILENVDAYWLRRNPLFRRFNAVPAFTVWLRESSKRAREKWVSECVWWRHAIYLDTQIKSWNHVKHSSSSYDDQSTWF